MKTNKRLWIWNEWTVQKCRQLDNDENVLLISVETKGECGQLDNDENVLLISRETKDEGSTFIIKWETSLLRTRFYSALGMCPIACHISLDVYNMRIRREQNLADQSICPHLCIFIYSRLHLITSSWSYSVRGSKPSSSIVGGIATDDFN